MCRPACLLAAGGDPLTQQVVHSAWPSAPGRPARAAAMEEAAAHPAHVPQVETLKEQNRQLSAKARRGARVRAATSPRPAQAPLTQPVAARQVSALRDELRAQEQALAAARAEQAAHGETVALVARCGVAQPPRRSPPTRGAAGAARRN